MTAHIEIQLFATLSKFLPKSSDKYPISEGTTVVQLIDQLHIPGQQAKLIFINRNKRGLTSVLKDGDRIGIFPPIGGG
jgi:molybdopterin converting factor small subunit